jgi:hypothetical protein
MSAKVSVCASQNPACVKLLTRVLPGGAPESSARAAGSGGAARLAARGGKGARAAQPGAGELLPLPAFPYRRVRIQGDQGRGVLGCRSTV